MSKTTIVSSLEILLFCSVFFLICSISYAVIAPWYANCMNLGYELVPMPNGSLGCKLPNNKIVDPILFYEGKVEKEYNICGVNGLETVSVKLNQTYGLEYKAYCLSSDGQLIPSEAIIFNEKPQLDKKICNVNRVCEPQKGENYFNCPTDCKNPVSSKPKYLLLIGLLVAIAIGALAIWKKYLYRH